MIPERNCGICHPNRIDSATLSGGAWVESLPLENLQDRALARIARSIDADPESTWFDIAFDRQRTIDVIAFIAHNFSFSCRLRLRASDQSDFSTLKLDSTFDAWPAVSGDWNIDELEWENDNYWLGSYTQEDTEGQTPIASRVLPSPVQARYWRIDIADSNNPAGYIDLGRVFIGNVFLRTKINMSYGASFGYEDSTGIETAISGAEYFDPREPIPVVRFELAYMSEEEAYAQALELIRRAGLSKEVFFIFDPTDSTYAPQRNIYGRLRQLNPLELASFRFHRMAFEIKGLR